MINSIIDPQLNRGASTNQIPVWNDTTKRFEVSVSLSGLTLVSPVVSGDHTWTGLSTWYCDDQPKTVQIAASGEFNFRKGVSNDWLRLNTQSNNIAFGNTTDNPAYNFLGTGLTTLGGALEVAGVIKSESGKQVKTNRLTANTTLDKTYHEVFCDTDGGAFTVTLPAAPADGQTYRITNTGSSANDITVARNGNLLQGGTVDKTASDGTTIILTFEPTEGWW